MKKFLLTAISVLTLTLFAFAFVGCDSGTPTGGTNAEQGESTNGGEEHTHAYGTWAWVNEPTCSESGSMERVCACGHKETQSMSARHSYGEWSVVSVPTCFHEGQKERSCACGDKQTESIPATGVHEYGEWQIESATCGKAGSRTKECACGDKIVETIFATGAHYFFDDYCTVCGASVPTEGLEYRLSNDGTYYIVIGIGTATEKKIVIPNRYKGLPVLEIDSISFQNCTELLSVEIPESIQRVGSRAFEGSTGIIEVSAGVSYVDTWVVDCDEQVTDVSLRENTIGIAAGAFKGCDKIQSITLPQNLKYIGNSSFQLCSSLQSIEIPDGIKTIEMFTFSRCKKLKSIKLPESLKIIKDNAFSLCDALQEITLPNQLERIESKAFASCSGLRIINIPNKVNFIDYEAFYQCKNLVGIDFSCNISSVEDSMFLGCNELKQIVLTNKIKNIADRAFEWCNSLEKVYYEGNSTEWSQVKIGLDNEELTNATRYYYSETQPTDTVNKYWHYVGGEIVEW